MFFTGHSFIDMYSDLTLKKSFTFISSILENLTKFFEIILLRYLRCKVSLQ